jgi:cell division protein FtsW
MDPWKDPFNDGFQLTQSLMAIGRGEWTGVGLGSSVLKLSYLPEAHTDFIFAVIGEELGLAGILAVMGLFALVVGRGLYLGLKGVDVGQRFAGYVAFGISLMIGLQALVSIGVNLGALPTKGLTLPLISYGGSSMVLTCAMAGVLLRATFEINRALDARQGTQRVAVQAAEAAPAAAPAREREAEAA